MKALHKARSILGWGANTRIAEACGVTSMSVGRWMARGRLPDNEIIGRTRYAKQIEILTNRQVKASELRRDIEDAIKANSEAA